jgi:hypothetical protein
MTLFLSLLLSLPARAECPWEKVESVSATMTSVTINGNFYPVKGGAARGMFLSTLAQCKTNPAAMAAFQEWRQMRQFTNASAGIGLCLLWPVLLVTPVTAIMAGNQKDNLVVALMMPPVE